MVEQPANVRPGVRVFVFVMFTKLSLSLSPPFVVVFSLDCAIHFFLMHLKKNNQRIHLPVCSTLSYFSVRKQRRVKERGRDHVFALKLTFTHHFGTPKDEVFLAAILFSRVRTLFLTSSALILFLLYITFISLRQHYLPFGFVCSKADTIVNISLFFGSGVGSFMREPIFSTLFEFPMFCLCSFYATVHGKKSPFSRCFAMDVESSVYVRFCANIIE